MEQQYEIAVAEIKEAKNLQQKDLLLQKYGIITPKLTQYEKDLIAFEEIAIKAYGSDIGFVRLAKVEGATV